MSNDRTGTWDQIKSKLDAHWGKLSVEHLCLRQSRSQADSRPCAAKAQPEALMPEGLALARHGS
jgi:hypothetical protein